jgi:hypothetical protein
MKLNHCFIALVGVAIAAVMSGCIAANQGTLPGGPQPPPPTSTPAATKLYLDHNGTFYEYALPLAAGAKPLLTLPEWPGSGIVPVIAADQYGNVALASPTELRFFGAPIRSFAASAAKLRLTLTPAITEVGTSGADLSDLEYDPNENLWLFNNLGAEITELRAPINKSSVAALAIGFGAPGSKTAGFTTLVQGRFDVNATLYVYASSSSTSRLFKVAFPYAKPPSSDGVNLAQADFIDSSQWPPTAPIQPSLLLGQYDGPLHSPKPGSPPSPPVDVMAQFPQPFDPQQGHYPAQHTPEIAGALTADPYRYRFYALDAGNGDLNVYKLPMSTKAAPQLTLACLGGPTNCSEKGEHVFLAP